MEKGEELEKEWKKKVKKNKMRKRRKSGKKVNNKWKIEEIIIEKNRKSWEKRDNETKKGFRKE